MQILLGRVETLSRVSSTRRALFLLFICIFFSFEVDGPGHVTKAIRACVYVGFRDMDEGAEFFLLLSPAVLMRKEPIIRQL